MKLRPRTFEELGKASLAVAVAHVAILLLQPLSKVELNLLTAVIGGIFGVLFVILGIILLERGGRNE